MSMIHFLPQDVKVEIADGVPVLDAALENDVQIEHNCGGNCACSTCHIIIEDGWDNLEPATEDEIDMLDDAENLTERSRLACQVMVKGDLKVSIPEA